LHTLISGVPTAANAGYYAEIVAERAILRRLVEAGTRIVQMGYGAADGQGMAGTVDNVVDRAQPRSTRSPSGGLARTTYRSRRCSRARWTTWRESRRAAVGGPVYPPASRTWTRSPTVCIRVRWWSWLADPEAGRHSRSTRRSPPQ